MKKVITDHPIIIQKSDDPKGCGIYHRSQMMEIGKKENLERLSSELKKKDWFMTFLDLEDYIRTKERALEDYTDRKTWAKKMLANISNAGFFFF